MIKPLNSIGDTLIEVLIATAIVSSILGGAYVTSNRSLRTTRQAEERVEALKYAESQVEKLRVASAASTSACDSKDIFCSTPPASTNFCLDAAGVRTDFMNGPPPSKDTDNFSTTIYPSGCKSTTDSVDYYIWIERAAGTPPASNFTVHTRWPSYGSTVNDEVTLQYRLSK